MFFYRKCCGRLLRGRRGLKLWAAIERLYPDMVASYVGGVD